MLIQALQGGFTRESFIQLLLMIPIILISLTVHECSHGYAAYLCGDMTARNLGRLTLNPIKHLDPIGTLMMLFFGFGYAKPVPINMRNFRKPRRDLCLVSIAGPLSNLVLAFVWLMIYRFSLTVVINTGDVAVMTSNFLQMWIVFSGLFVSLNIGLAVFNLIPIPPLDGSRLLSVILPPKIAYKMAQYERYIMLAVFVLLWLGKLDGIIVFFRNGLLQGMNFLLDFIPIFLKIG